MFQYLWIFFGAAVVSYVLSHIIKRLALRWQIVDHPASAPDRKLQIAPIPLLGGIAVYLAFTGFALLLAPQLTQGYLLVKHLLGIIIAGAIIMIGGALDDKYSLPAKVQMIFPILACIVVIASGIGISFITNPFGGVMELNQWEWTLFTINHIPYHLTILADMFTVIWLMSTMYTTKLLDGLDGLVPGITAIGGVIIFLVSNSQTVAQPETATLALILAGAAAGFLILNFSPAKIYLGEGGSVFTGFMLGVLAILSGGKIATALLILGLPVIDLAWVIIRRILIEKKSPFSADTSHLHFQLRQLGLSTPAIVLLFYGITIVFGISTLFVEGVTKTIVLAILFFASAIALLWLFIKTSRSQS